jgi:acyl carrier protein
MPVTSEDVVRIVRVQLGKSQVRESDRLMEDLGAESADMANLVAAVEERYGVRIPEADFAAIRTVSDLHRLVERLA